ncbi:hypothetical protein SAMN04487897_101141 [Paenibacillus sp. yr247]|uniref:hypothetical protein n=1 Tax=Paenibacillus sp. yr247 TaxID=1761880 RepID=UPI000885A093|nr:hypothetical protein [Paenibacillus sp. yr247]SDM81714.1 hypothetical protein SAMN04487897_101141 [Paenibacillus sp. yr247]
MDSNPGVELLNSLEQARKHAIIYDRPAATFFEGAFFRMERARKKFCNPEDDIRTQPHSTSWERWAFVLKILPCPPLSMAGSRLQIHNPWEKGAKCIHNRGEEMLSGDIITVNTMKGEHIRFL